MKTRRIFICLLLIIVRGIAATLLINGGTLLSNMMNILIGLKYGLYSTIIFYTATRVGYSSPLTQSDIIDYTAWLTRIVAISVLIGFGWQLLKWIFPQGFYQILGYGQIGDYVAGSPHPIYYRTGPGGIPRFSGLMSGPNNLGYLLVAYTSIIPLYVTSWWLKITYYLGIVMTLSRAALIGSGIQGLTILIRRYRKYHRYILLSITMIGILGIGALSLVKSSSTTEHIVRKRGAVQEVVNHPRGIGLGSSGPGVHWNGSVLPENFYLQLILDYGTIPFIIWCVLRIMVIRTAKLIISQNPLLEKPMRAYISGLVGLLIVGLFLHVFEDSIVNYLFFIPFGLLWGYGLRPFAKSTGSEYTSE